MFGIGTSELLIIVGLALILLGPKKLPELARSIGKTMGDLRKTTDELKETIAEELEPLKEEMPDTEDLTDVLKEQFMGEEETDEKGEEPREEDRTPNEEDGPRKGQHSG